MDLGTAPDLIFHKLWGRAAWLAGAGEKHRCGDGAPLIGPATERSGQRRICRSAEEQSGRQIDRATVRTRTRYDETQVRVPLR